MPTFRYTERVYHLLVEGYEQLEKRKNQIEEKLEKLIDSLDFGDNLKEIDGIETLTVARIIAYMGNPYRFKSGKEVASFAGLIPKSNQSGKMDKGKILSKKGHKNSEPHWFRQLNM